LDFAQTNVDELGRIEETKEEFYTQGQNKHHLAAARSIQLGQAKRVLLNLHGKTTIEAIG
jgi:hypothetical protein